MSKFRKFIECKGSRLFANITLFCLGAYISFQKLTDFSIYEWFDGTFTVVGWKGVKWTALSVVGTATIMKGFSTYFEIYPEGDKKAQEPERIAQCLLRINQEIKEHLSDFNAVPDQACSDLGRYHHFQDNLRIIVGNMADHIVRAFPGLKGLKERDIFISLFDYVPDAGALKYLCHWKPNRENSVVSPEIQLKGRFEKYECVKAINQSSNIIIKWDCADYEKGGNRGKIHHYVGMRMEIGGRILSFLNIEFHNRSFFPDEATMYEFVENELIAFKYLIEYQFLKREFFSGVTNNLKEVKKS
ncbi:MAG: hypothetical protein V4599_07530 [Verrucomicrobiota bacterium]